MGILLALFLLPGKIAMSLLGPQLDAFLAVVKNNTVNAAAETLFLTQTAVTQRIKALETQLRTSVFTRTRRGMVLTQEGKALLKYCQSALLLEGEVMAQIQGAGVETTTLITLTAPTSTMQSRLIPSLVPLVKKFPKLRYQFCFSDIEIRHNALREGRVDFAVLEQSDLAPEMQMKPLVPENYVLVASAEWKSRSLEEILSKEPMIDFDPQDRMTLNYLKHYELQALLSHGGGLQDRHYADDTVAIARLVSKGLGYTALTEEFVMRYVDKGELIILNEGKVFQHPLVLAWYDRPEPPAYFKAIVNAIK